MHTQKSLQSEIEQLGIKPSDTLLIHSSMKAIGEVEGGADTVLDAFSDYLRPGLLILPTHTWRQINADNPIFNVKSEPSCVGILTELFRQRPNVIRSWHPTHSVAALGAGAQEFTDGEEQFDTPCPREGCWGKLYDRKAKILFLGADISRNTIIHGVEEWAGVPNRLTQEHEQLKILTPAGRLLDRPMRRHSSPIRDISANYSKLGKPLLATKIAIQGKIGDAQSILVDVVSMVDLTLDLLRKDPDLFLDGEPVPSAWY